MVRSFHKKVSLTVRNTFIYVPIVTLYSDHIDTFRKLYVTFCMWNDLTFLWNELTFFGGGGGTISLMSGTIRPWKEMTGYLHDS